MVTSFIFGKDMYIIRAIIQTEKATKKIGGADVVAGDGIHKVVYGDITWNPSTNVEIRAITESQKASAQKQ